MKCMTCIFHIASEMTKYFSLTFYCEYLHKTRFSCWCNFNIFISLFWFHKWSAWKFERIIRDLGTWKTYKIKFQSIRINPKYTEILVANVENFSSFEMLRWCITFYFHYVNNTCNCILVWVDETKMHKNGNELKIWMLLSIQIYWIFLLIDMRQIQRKSVTLRVWKC